MMDEMVPMLREGGEDEMDGETNQSINQNDYLMQDEYDLVCWIPMMRMVWMVLLLYHQ